MQDSLKSSAPLKRRVARYITEDTLKRVAQAGREEQRRLYAGTVNYDTGRLVIWDLTAIAMDETNQNRLALYRQVVLASASIPILVPPVKIDGNLYADGGARAQTGGHGARARPATGNGDGGRTGRLHVHAAEPRRCGYGPSRGG